MVLRSSLKSIISLEFLACFFMILMSGTVYFSIINRRLYQLVFFAICIIVIISRRKHISFNNVRIVIPFILLFVINLMINNQDLNEDGLNTIAGYILKFFLCSLISSCFDKKKLVNAYLSIMTCIIIISLVCFYIQINYSFIPYLIALSSDYNDLYFYSLYHTWGWGGVVFDRNSGPFWEPGAFQGFLTMGIIMLVLKVENNKKNPPKVLFTLLLFMFGILTTGSSTAFVLLGLIVLYKYRYVIKTLQMLPPAIKYCTSLVLVLGVLIYIYNSNNLQDKIAGTNNSSAEIRSNDIQGGVQIALVNPIFGVGVTKTRDKLKTEYKVAHDDSCGLTNIGYEYGLLFLIYYLICAYKGVRHFFGERNSRFVYFIFIIMSMTEGIWPLPFYLYLIFYREKCFSRQNYRTLAV